MSKKKLIQRLQNLIDTLPLGNDREDVYKDIKMLKLSKDNQDYIKLSNKYK